MILLAAFCSTQVHGQNVETGSTYETAAGFKYYPASVTIKSFVNQTAAVEGLVSFWDYGIRFTGLYEFYKDINTVEGLKWYVGPGVHFGFWNNHWSAKYPDRDDGIMIGVGGVIGLDYKIKNIPVNLSLDWQPSLTFVGYNYFEAGWGGIAVRYAF